MPRSEPWARRLPKEDDHRLYIARDVATVAISAGHALTDVVDRLQVDFVLSQSSTLKALRAAGVPLKETEQAVGKTLSATDQLGTEDDRECSTASLDLDRS